MSETDAERRLLDAIEAIAHGQAAMVAKEHGLGSDREAYVTNAATRNLLKGLVRAFRQQGAPTMSEHPWNSCDGSCECHAGICWDCGCTNALLARIAGAAPIDAARVGSALRLAWLDSNDALGHALPPDLAGHLLARLSESTE